MPTNISIERVIGIVLAVGAIVMAVVTPGIANAILWLLEHRANERFAGLVFKTLEQKENAARHKDIIATHFADDLRLNKETRDAVDANTDRIEAVFGSVGAHGSELKELRKLVQDVPSAAAAIEKMGRAVERIGRGMTMMGESVARIDERQKMMWPIIEQRTKQEPGGPRRRAADFEEGDAARD